MVTNAPSVFPLQASKAAWGGLLRSPRGGLPESSPAHDSVGAMAPSMQSVTSIFLWSVSMVVSCATVAPGGTGHRDADKKDLLSGKNYSF